MGRVPGCHGSRLVPVGILLILFFLIRQMYRSFVHNTPSDSIYCPIWPCDRKCGLFHLPLLKPTENKNKPSTSIDESTDSGRPSTTGLSGDFEDIMARAVQKVSISYTEPPLPPPLIIPETGRKEEGELSPHVDTTFLFWEEEAGSQDSEENGIVFADPPSFLDSESTLSELVSRNRHEPDANPIFHDRIDSRIDSEEDDNDYSKLDAVPPRLSHRDSLDSLTPSVMSNQLNKAKRWRRAHYEPSLDVVS